MAWLIVALVLSLVGCVLWIAYRKPAPQSTDIDNKKIESDFDKKKADEHARIEKLNAQQLVDDLNSRLRN